MGIRVQDRRGATAKPPPLARRIRVQRTSPDGTAPHTIRVDVRTDADRYCLATLIRIPDPWIEREDEPIGAHRSCHNRSAPIPAGWAEFAPALSGEEVRAR